MHPKMMIALAREFQRDRRREPQRVLASGFARRLLAGTSLRPRLS
jgi:hypothetical protein